MENPKTPTKALAMSEEQWNQNKLWLLQFPAAFSLPVIEQFERYLFELHPPAPLKGGEENPANLKGEVDNSRPDTELQELPKTKRIKKS